MNKDLVGPADLPAPRAAVPLVEMRGIVKAFGGVRAVDDVDLDLFEAEVHAVCGENGAGKSTLMKILAGIHHMDAGSIRIGTHEATIHEPADARSYGVAIVTQDLSVVPTLDVASNILLGREPVRHRWFTNRKQTYASAKAAVEELGVDLSLRAEVGKLSKGSQQLVEICKALAVNVRVLILDEPTSALSVAEREHLFDLIRSLRRKGLAIVYISHVLPEVLAISDRITVLRDGKRVSSRLRAEVSERSLVIDMVGRDREVDVVRGERDHGDVIMAVRGMSSSRIRDISFDLRKGEILGLGGMMGSGRTEILRALFGLDRVVGGEVMVEGRRLKVGSPGDAIGAGMILVPEDRALEGVVGVLSVERNLSVITAASRWGLIRGREAVAGATRIVRELGIRARSIKQDVMTLSGGNQQKVVIGRALASEPRIFLLDEPTAGIDVAAKSDVLRLVVDLASRGAGVVFASSELPELISISDRVLVLRKGEIVAELEGEQITQEAIGALATGADGHPPSEE